MVDYIEQIEECVLEMICRECGNELDTFDAGCPCPCHGLV